MRYLFTIFLLILGKALLAYPSLPEPESDRETLFIRRIIDFWRDKEYPFAKAQIQSYLQEYPESHCADHFYAMLGDMAMHTKAYQEALEYYDKIHTEEIKALVAEKRWQALYQMELYTQLYQEIAPSLYNVESEEGHFYFAEAAFREALTLLRYPEGQEEAHSLCEEALPYYSSLENSEIFADHSKLAMAEIYRILNRPEKAASLYLDLAEKEKSNDEILFHAAGMLHLCDKERAIKIFEKIAKGSSAKASDAAFQWLQMLAEERQWGVIAHERDLFISHLKKEQLQIGFFYLGMIAYDRQMFHQAVADLTKSLEGTFSHPFEKKALFILLLSASELNKLDLCEKSYQRLTSHFPDGNPEASYLLARAYQHNGDKNHALALYSQLLHKFPESEFAEKGSIEKVRLLMDQKNWNEAHDTVLSFLDYYPESKKKPEMVRLAIDLTLNQLAEEEVYAQLVDDLERGLILRVFHDEEKQEKQFLLAKAYLKLDRVEAALLLLQEIKDPDPLLLAQCYIKEKNSPEKVISYGEEALAKAPTENKLHFHLFNAYLELSKKNQDESLTHKAAEHLNAVKDLYPISLENLLWLAHYYSKQNDPNAIPILEALLQTETSIKRFEEEALTLASLYQNHEAWDKAEELLEKIVAMELKTEAKAKLALASVAYERGKIEQATELYQKLEESAQLNISYAAQLQLARLLFGQSPEKSLKKLHDLKVHKTLANEPIHLEAALDYAELKASQFPEESQPQTLLKLLLEVKEDFTKQEDIWSKDYHAGRELLPEKEQIYQAYMRYLDARIFSLQAQEAYKKENLQEARAKLNAARALFSTLRRGKYAVSKYIIEKSITGMYEE